MKTLTSISKRTRRIAAVAALLLLVASTAVGVVASGNLNLGSLAGAAVAGSTCTVGASGATYTTIQAAVNDAGCATINVTAGTYKENVTISRAVTINGAGASSTIVDGGGYSCATPNQCTVFTINQPVSVTFSGLTIQRGFTLRAVAR